MSPALGDFDFDAIQAQAQAAALPVNRQGNVIQMPKKEPMLLGICDWMARATPPAWVIDDLLQGGMVYALTAPTNHGKTAVSMVVALSVAAGREFAGRKLKKGKVLILCGENPEGFLIRLKSTMAAMLITPESMEHQIVALPASVQLGTCVSTIVEEASKYGEFSLVLVDTSAAFFTGEKEDDNVLAREHAVYMRRLTELPGKPAVLVNCHPTKGAGRDALVPRGGGAFLNEIDTNFTVWSDGRVAEFHWQGKIRSTDFDPVYFLFKTDIAEEYGVKVPSMYAEVITTEQYEAVRGERRKIEDLLLLAMDTDPSAGYRRWAVLCQLDPEKDLSKLSRVMKRLKFDGLVGHHRGSFKLTKAGTDEVSILKKK